MTLKEIHDEFAARFRGEGFDDARLESSLLLRAILNLNSSEMLTRPDLELSSADESRARVWLAARLRGEPLAYLTGLKGFYKSEFLVGPGVLVPRPETELLVEIALRREPAGALYLADLGSGSGCVGLSLALERPGLQLWAVDASPVAVDFTRRNAERLGLSERTHVVHSRVEEWRPAEKFSLVVANPPYIPEGEPNVEPGVHAFEPHEALYSGASGLDALTAWAAWAAPRLRDGGVFVTEFGLGQAGAVEDILALAGFRHLEIARDLAGHERAISATVSR